MTEPPRSQAVYRYWVCDLRSGAKIAELPLKPGGDLPDRIGDVSSTNFSCDVGAVWRDGGDFRGVTTPGRTVVVVEREYEGDSVSDIIWAGIVTGRPGGTLTCATIPSYLNRRYPATNRTYRDDIAGDTDGQILTDLLADAAPEGIGFVIDIDCPTPRTFQVTVKDNRPILAYFKDLTDTDGGPEWTVSTRWTDANRTAIQHVFTARTRLGWAGDPNVTFDYPGCITQMDPDDDFTEGHGGNHISAINSTGASSDPARDEQAITQQGWPRWEERVSTSSDLDAAGLNGVAKSNLQKRARGQTTAALVVDMAAGPQYGREWTLGDNVLWFVAGPEDPTARRTDPAGQPPSFDFPDGHSEVIRVIGVAINPLTDRITPVIWSPYDDTTTN